jgi:hypothetical protein
VVTLGGWRAASVSGDVTATASVGKTTRQPLATAKPEARLFFSI